MCVCIVVSPIVTNEFNLFAKSKEYGAIKKDGGHRTLNTSTHGPMVGGDIIQNGSQFLRGDAPISKYHYQVALALRSIITPSSHHHGKKEGPLNG